MSLVGIVLCLQAAAAHAGWKNDQGTPVALEDFRGKWVVASMMYTSCQASCPLIVQKMRRIETLLKEGGKNAEFLLITFDPERDTPAKLKKYREKTGINEANWHFWSGTVTNTRKQSMIFGIKYAKDPESGDFMHDNKIVLISPKGKIEAKLQTLGDSESELLQAMGKGEKK